MARGTPIRLPSGSEATLRPFRGADEEWVASLTKETPEPVFVTRLLCRLITAIDGTRATPRDVKLLTVQDRDVLLLCIALTAFGPSVHLVLTCPETSCAARMDATFNLNEFRRHLPAVPKRFTFDTEDRTLSYRLPNGEDLEAALSWSGLDRDEKRHRLLARCVTHSTGPFSEIDLATLAASISEHARAADIEITAVCPECQARFTERLDPARWLLAELRRAFTRFEREVHLLALHYHWPLRQLLSMPRQRRNRWASLLVRQLDGTSSKMAGVR